MSMPKAAMSASMGTATDPLQWSLLCAHYTKAADAALLRYAAIGCSEGLCHGCSLGCCLLNGCSRDPERKLWQSLQEAGQLM